VNLRPVASLALLLLLFACGGAEEEGRVASATAAPDAAPGSAKTAAAAAKPAARKAPAAPVFDGGHWRPLEDDGLHDTANPALRLLQQPAEALSVLPPAQEGNFVDWVMALRTGAIEPRTNIFPETKIRVIDLDVIMPDTAGMPMVLFPHRPHTEWLDCENCHDKIFKAKRGANPVNMFEVLQGNYCGQCHGAVSFPLTQCQRCHSVARGAAPPAPAAPKGGG
jgi:c(7)-type cytochrome triheme protein